MASKEKTPQVEAPDDLMECRKAFVAAVKLEEYFREKHCRLSLKAARGGKMEGFHDRKVQERWLAFRSGWNARDTQEHLRFLEKHTAEWIKSFPAAVARPPAVITGGLKK